MWLNGNSGIILLVRQYNFLIMLISLIILISRVSEKTGDYFPGLHVGVGSAKAFRAFGSIIWPRACVKPPGYQSENKQLTANLLEGCCVIYLLCHGLSFSQH